MKTFVKVLPVDADNVALVEDLAEQVENLVNKLVETNDVKIVDVTVTPIQTHDSVYEDGRIYNYTYSGWIVTVLYKANKPI